MKSMKLQPGLWSSSSRRFRSSILELLVTSVFAVDHGVASMDFLSELQPPYGHNKEAR